MKIAELECAEPSVAVRGRCIPQKRSRADLAWQLLFLSFDDYRIARCTDLLMIFDYTSRLQPDPAVLAGLRDLAENASLELTPSEALRLEARPAGLAPNSEIYLTNLRAAREDDLVAAAARLRRLETRPVAHLAARRVSSRNALRTLAHRLVESGCDRALVIAGDEGTAAGPFRTSLDLLETGELEHAGFTTIGIGGHPEGSPQIANALLWDALGRKNEYARSSTAKFRIVTQFCFDGKAAVRWEREARQRGNQFPVHVGVPGLTTTTKLIRFAATCGVTVSANFLRRQSWSAVQLARRWQPDEFVTNIAAGKLSDSGSLIERLHFFPFGAVQETIEYIGALNTGTTKPRNE